MFPLGSRLPPSRILRFEQAQVAGLPYVLLRNVDKVALTFRTPLRFRRLAGQPQRP